MVKNQKFEKKKKIISTEMRCAFLMDHPVLHVMMCIIQ